MAQIVQHNRLMPWYIGIAIVLAAVIYVGYQIYATDCGLTMPIALGVLFVIPVVYLGLMYLTFTSQE